MIQPIREHDDEPRQAGDRRCIETPQDVRRAIGVGMLGYGFMGRAHTNAFRTVPYTFWQSTLRPELVVISGRTDKAVREAAVRFGFVRYTTDWRALTENPDVQIFDNVATSDAHVEPTLAAIAAGKHVICEKPLALTALAADRLHRAAAQAGVKHLTCFNYRFFPAVRLARDLLSSGELGDVYEARFRYAQDWRLADTALLQSREGALTIIGSHAIDQARFLVGEIERVAARISCPTDGTRRTLRDEPLEPVDAATILVEFAKEVIGTIDVSLVSSGRKNLLTWEINGSKGSLAWSLEELNVLKLYRHAGSKLSGFCKIITCESEHQLAEPWWPSGHLLGWEHGHVNMIAHFLRAIEADAPVEPHGATFADGARAARVVEAAAEAALSCEWIELPP